MENQPNDLEKQSKELDESIGRLVTSYIEEVFASCESEKEKHDEPCVVMMGVSSAILMCVEYLISGLSLDDDVENYQPRVEMYDGFADMVSLTIPISSVRHIVLGMKDAVPPHLTDVSEVFYAAMDASMELANQGRIPIMVLTPASLKLHSIVPGEYDAE